MLSCGTCTPDSQQNSINRSQSLTSLEPFKVFKFRHASPGGTQLRHARRRLRKAPAFTLTTTLTLALGIGATTSIFTLVHAVLLKSLPVSNPDQLYRLGKRSYCCIWGGYVRNEEFVLVSYDLYQYFRDHTQGFEEMAGFHFGFDGVYGITA